MEAASFDAYAHNYDAALQAGLRITGEDKDYFARERLRQTKHAIDLLLPGCGRDKGIDFGCGTGDSTFLLKKEFGFETNLGLDVSAESLGVAAKEHRDDAIQFDLISDHQPGGDADLLYCNGVFHHIPPAERNDSLAYVYQSLKPGGAFVLWENNPYNPGVHLVMRAIPFDRDAQLLTPAAALRLVRGNGFKVLQLRFYFVFPRLLATLRRYENGLSRLPLGAQYQIVAAKNER